MRLPFRLRPLLSWFDPAMVVVDIGANHGYLAKTLATMTSSPVYATEYSNPSFAHLLHELEGERVLAYQADGLQKLPTEVNTAIITGMGGRLILSMLAIDPFPSNLKTLWLGPQSHVDELRLYLSNHGWKIIKETIVADAGQFYPFLFVVKGDEPLSNVQAYLGPRLMETKESSFLAWMKHESMRLATLSQTVSLPEEEQHRLQWLQTYVKH
jgi:tRNA (adenine22-N1)-methyltransferase